MDSSHVAAGTITALIATALVYLSSWPLQPLDLPTASAFAGLIVAGAGAGVKLYQSYRPAPAPAPILPVLNPSATYPVSGQLVMKGGKPSAMTTFGM